MALDFPSGPTDGQIYDRYVWNNTLGVWSLLSDTTVFGLASNTPTGSYTDGANYEYVSFTSDGTLTVTRGGVFISKTFIYLPVLLMLLSVMVAL